MEEIRDISKETLDVLEYFDDEFRLKIPEKVINKLEELALESKVNTEIDTSKELCNQKISEECKCLISLIYYDYVADEEEKKEILSIWNENERAYQEELSKSFNMDDIFKRNKQDSVDDVTKESKIKSNDEGASTEDNLPTVINENNIFKKIWNSIKKWLSNFKG